MNLPYEVRVIYNASSKSKSLSSSCIYAQIGTRLSIMSTIFALLMALFFGKLTIKYKILFLLVLGFGSGSFVESPRQKKHPTTAVSQLEFLFIDRIQH